MGEMFSNDGDLLHAEENFKKAMAIHLKHYPEEHPEVQIDRCNLKAVQVTEGEPKGWSTVLITALGSWEKLVPRGHYHSINLTL